MPPLPIERLVAWIERRRRAVLVSAGLVFLLSGLSVLRLEIEMDLLAQLPQGSRVFRDFRTVLERFGARDTLIVLVSGESADLLPFAEALAERLRSVPGIESVRHRFDTERLRAEVLRPWRWQLLTDEDWKEVERRIEPAAIRERVAGLRRALAVPFAAGASAWVRSDPLGFDAILGRSLERRYADPLFRPASGYFLSPSGRSVLILVRPTGSAFDSAFGRKLLPAIRAAEDELLAGSFAGRGIRVGHTGSYVYAFADREIMEQDFTLYFVFVPLAVLAIFYLGLRTLRVLPFAVVPLAFATAVTFALSLAVFGRLTMISVAFAGIFYGLGVDSSIYFYATLRPRAPRSRAEIGPAIAGTLREIGAANLVASTTTAAAFFVIAFSEFTGVRQLGLLTAVAMLANVLGTFVLLPAMIFAWGPGAVPAAADAGRLGPLYDRLAGALVSHRRSVLTLVAVVTVVLAGGTTRVRLETDFRHLHPGGGEAAEVEREVQREFGRADARAIVVNRGGDLEQALRDAEEIAHRLERYRDEQQIESFSTITAFVPSAETARARFERLRSLPRERAVTSLRAALAAEGFRPDAFAPFFADWLAREAAAVDPLADALAPLREQHLRDEGGEVFVATYVVPKPGERLATIAARLRADLPTIDPIVAGQDLAAEEFHRILGGELLGFAAGALLLNFLIVLAFERSVAGTLRLLLPTLGALVATVGIMGFAGIPFDPINLIVLPLILGLGVDATVYLVSHLRHGRRVGEGAGRGLVPMLLALATTIVGFGSLALARFPALGTLGLLAAMGLGLGALATLLLVPILEAGDVPAVSDRLPLSLRR